VEQNDDKGLDAGSQGDINRNHHAQSGRRKSKIKPLCTTRWVERHTALRNFADLYEPLIECLASIANAVGRKWDHKSKTEALGLLHQIRSSGFIVAFQTAAYTFGFTKTLSQSLQGSTMDVIEGYTHVKTVTEQLQKVRDNAEEEFSTVYSKSEAMAKTAGVTLSKPRLCGRQTERANVTAPDLESYYRRSFFIPFTDDLVSQLRGRFKSLSSHALQALLLLPSNLSRLSGDALQNLTTYYSPDLPSASNVLQEIQLWKCHW